MKISFNWLKTLSETSINPERVSEILTGCGLEVESMEHTESVKGGLKGLVVGEVLTCEKHPDADKLKLTIVNVGTDTPLHIVCGAPNVAAGQKVIVALPGTTLYPTVGEPFVIKKSKIRGATSEGMLCADDEIGTGTSHEGIRILDSSLKAGTPLSEVIKVVNDTIFEIGITPNRSDALSHFGVARDLSAVAAVTQEPIPFPVIQGLYELPAATGLNTIDIQIMDDLLCGRYSGLVISGIQVAESPDWLKLRLQSIGVKPINNIVDITNFVMFELGQPLHAFDFHQIKDRKIIVRNAQAGETLTTLDGQSRVLDANDLVIADGQSPICLAGVFGGLHSGIQSTSTAVFLESAWFNASAVRKTAKHHGLKTDASFRFERGTDPEITVKALIRAAHLIIEIAGGTLSMNVVDVYPKQAEPSKVAFSYKNCNELIGKEIDRTTIKKIIQALEMEIVTEGTDGLLLHVPRYRTDVTREADVIEEILRIYGYNQIEPSRKLHYSIPTVNTKKTITETMANLLEANGFNEVMSLSLTSASLAVDSSVTMLNPLSQDLTVLRTQLLHSALPVLAHNLNHKQEQLRLFEIGKTYHQYNGKYVEQLQLAIYITGEILSENPYKLSASASHNYLKGVVEMLLKKCGIHQFNAQKIENDAVLAYGQSLQFKKKELVKFGAIQSALLQQADITQPVFHAILNLENIEAVCANHQILYSGISRFMPVRRDLALLLDQHTEYAEVEKLAFDTEKKLLKKVDLFDVYEDAKLNGRKSYAMAFTLQSDEATLTDKQIDAVMEKLIKTYKEKLGAELRS